MKEGNIPYPNFKIEITTFGKICKYSWIVVGAKTATKMEKNVSFVYNRNYENKL